MIKFEEIEKRQYNIVRIEGKDKKIIIPLFLSFSPITNKFFRLTEFVEDCSVQIGSEFDNWFCTFLTDYQKSNYNYAIVKDNLNNLMTYCDKYLDLCNINFEGYINKSKKSKNSIFLTQKILKR